MKKLSFFLPLLMLVFSCSNTKVGTDEYKGIVTDMTGLDGCGMMIKLDNGTSLQPVVLPQGFVLQKDKKVKLRYTILKDRMSTCMSGPVVQITSISYL
ncbi:MAG: hypothetical protein H7334_14565 [Ferruginibacter sp.]|nr:hypothetical protein [Ferruginibacter sp.]